MKKIILIALLFAGSGITAFAQNATTATAQTASQRSFNPSLFKEKSYAMETALKANNFTEAMNQFPYVQRMVMNRGDDYRLAKKNAEAKKLYDLGNQMKMMSQDLKGNKDKLLKIITEMQASYTN